MPKDELLLHFAQNIFEFMFPTDITLSMRHIMNEIHNKLEKEFEVEGEVGKIKPTMDLAVLK